MDRLGVNTRAREREDPLDNAKTNRMTVDTYNFDAGSNRNTTTLTYVRD